MTRTATTRHARARARRREGRKANAQAGVLQLGAAFGLLFALPRAISSSNIPDDCAEPGRCIASAVTDALIPMVLIVGAGVLIGAIIALLLCFIVSGLRRGEL